MQIEIQLCQLFFTVLSLEWQPNRSLCYMISFSEWSTIFHSQCWSLLIEPIDPNTSCLDWLLGGNPGIMGICVCACVRVLDRERESVEGGKAGISLMKSYRKSMSYWKEKNALPRGGCTRARTPNTHTHLTMRQSVMCYEQKKTKGLILKNESVICQIQVQC